MTASTQELSIIIPSYNEEMRLPNTLRQIGCYLRASNLNAEVIVVDDGSTDRTAEVAREFAQQFPGLRLVRNGVNRGKGFSVRQGMLQARGRIVLFTDADLSAPIEEADKLIAALATVDVAIGSRSLDRSLIQAHQSAFREFAGMVFNKIVRILLRLRFVDTQCGFKAFVRERCQIIFEQQRIERFGFDPELLYLARHHGLRIAEIPVRWSHSENTRVNVWRDSAMMFAEVVLIRWNAIRGRYRRAGGEARAPQSARTL